MLHYEKWLLMIKLPIIIKKHNNISYIPSMININRFLSVSVNLLEFISVLTSTNTNYQGVLLIRFEIL